VPVCGGVLCVQIINSDGVEESARETDGFFIKSGIVTADQGRHHPGWYRHLRPRHALKAASTLAMMIRP